MKKRLEKDEIRVMKLSREAIAEMLWESFMEVYHDRLDVPNDDHHVCHMTLNEDMSELTFYSCYSSSTQRPDFDAIDAFLKTEAVGAADGGGLVAAAIVDNDIIVLGVVGGQLLDHGNDAFFLIISGDDDE